MYLDDQVVALDSKQLSYHIYNCICLLLILLYGNGMHYDSCKAILPHLNLYIFICIYFLMCICMPWKEVINTCKKKIDGYNTMQRIRMGCRSGFTSGIMIGEVNSPLVCKYDIIDSYISQMAFVRRCFL